MKKVFCAVMVLALLLGGVACQTETGKPPVTGSVTDGTATSVPEETTEVLRPELPEKDMDGKVFTIPTPISCL